MRNALIILLFGAGGLKAAPICGYRIVAKYSRSTDSYTEGFSIWMNCFMRAQAVPVALPFLPSIRKRVNRLSVMTYRQSCSAKELWIGLLTFLSGPGRRMSALSTTA